MVLSAAKDVIVQLERHKELDATQYCMLNRLEVLLVRDNWTDHTIRAWAEECQQQSP